jgi:two-component system sensor histidine kinase RegB
MSAGTQSNFRFSGQSLAESTAENSVVSWLYQMRRGAFFAQLLVIAGAEFGFSLGLPVIPLLVLSLLIPASEIGIRALQQSGRCSEFNGLLGLLLIDTGLLSAMLYCTGGPSNPLSQLYLVHVVLAAVLLDARWTWGLSFITSVLYLLLFRYHIPIPALQHGHHAVGNIGGSAGMEDGLSSHLYAMYGAHVITTMLVAYFLTRILRSLRFTEERLLRIETNQRHLALMTTLSANAAHELGTPLSTIALVLDELITANNSGVCKKEVLSEELTLMNSEVARCKLVLDKFSVQSGTVAADKLSWTTPNQLIEALVSGDPEFTERVRFTNCSIKSYLIQAVALTIAIKGLLTNALQASDGSHFVSLTIDDGDDGLQFSVKDAGCGMSEAEVEQATIPFYTSKKDGMGLGLYLADLVAMQFGGSLKILSELGKGTEVILTVLCKSRMPV